MASEKNYYFVKQSAFNAFVADQEASNTLSSAAEKIATAQESGSLEITHDDPIVIFERTNTVRLKKARPVTTKLSIDSNRKLGKRAKKEEAQAVATTSDTTAAVVENSETSSPSVVENTETSARRTRRAQ